MDKTFELAGLAENQVWDRVVAPLLVHLPAPILDIAKYGLTGILNNAIHHSEGKSVRVMLGLQDQMLHMFISDDGKGIFRKVARRCALPDPYLSVLELSKGKLTTLPATHHGTGIFFISKIFDAFTLQSEEQIFACGQPRCDIPFPAPIPTVGTHVSMCIGIASPRTLAKVFDEFGLDTDGHFHKTCLPMRMARYGNENLLSRSQGKRVVSRLEEFRSAVLDFDGIPMIGQGFADEVFRVFSHAHPEVELVPINCNADVQAMIAHVSHRQHL